MVALRNDFVVFYKFLIKPSEKTTKKDDTSVTAFQSLSQLSTPFLASQTSSIGGAYDVFTYVRWCRSKQTVENSFSVFFACQLLFAFILGGQRELVERKTNMKNWKILFLSFHPKWNHFLQVSFWVEMKFIVISGLDKFLFFLYGFAIWDLILHNNNNFLFLSSFNSIRHCFRSLLQGGLKEWVSQ